MTFLLGRVFCWYFCPLWALQEWLRSFWKKLWIKKDYEFPKYIDKYLRYIKYFVLVWIVIWSIKYVDLVFRYFDPFVAFSHLWNEFDEVIYAYILLWIVVIWSLFTKSFWCRYACPLWAFFWIVWKFGFFKLVKDEKSCTKCNACTVSCPVWLDVNNMKEVNSVECISCLKCVKSCKFNSLKIQIWKKELKKKNFQLITILWFFSVLLIVIFTPIWQTKPITNLVWKDWKINVEDLRWSNTLEFVIRETKIPKEYFEEKLKLPKNVELSSKLKHIWEDYNIKNSEWNFIEMEDFKKVIEEYKK